MAAESVSPLTSPYRRPPWLTALYGFLLVFVLACITSPVGRRSGALTFLSPGNLSDILRQVSEKGILAVGMTLVIIAGGIDLSVGSLLALCATTAAVLLVYGQWGTLETLLLVLTLGAALGLFNGAVTAKGRIQPFVVTLAMMLAARGLARIVSGGAGVGLPFPAPGAVRSGYADGLARPATLGALALAVVLIAACIALGAAALTWLSRLPGDETRARLLARLQGGRRPALVVGALLGCALALWLRTKGMPESATAFSRAVLTISAGVGGLALGAGAAWAVLAALRWLWERKRASATLVGAVGAGVLIAALWTLSAYLSQLSMAARGATGMAPLSFKLLALRFGPPIDGWRDIIPAPAVIFLLVVLAVHFVMVKTRFGRYVYAIGGNERAARYSGIDVDGVKLRVYTLAGLLSALAGVIHCAQLEQGNPNDGFAYELDAIAAVVVGGTLLSGGAGSVIGTLFGVLIIGVIDNIMGLHVDKIDSNWQLITKGAIIIVTVLMQRRRTL